MFCAFTWFKSELHSLYLHTEINIHIFLFKEYTKQFQDTQPVLLHTEGAPLFDGTLFYMLHILHQTWSAPRIFWPFPHVPGFPPAHTSWCDGTKSQNNVHIGKSVARHFIKNTWLQKVLIKSWQGFRCRVQNAKSSCRRWLTDCIKTFL